MACDSRSMARALGATFLSVGLAVLIGVVGAAGLAAFRGGQFSEEFRESLWIVGCPMLLLTIFSFSPSTRHAQGELSNVFIGRRFAEATEAEPGSL
jgi:hypothetical protein